MNEKPHQQKITGLDNIIAFVHAQLRGNDNATFIDKFSDYELRTTPDVDARWMIDAGILRDMVDRFTVQCEYDRINNGTFSPRAYAIILGGMAKEGTSNLQPAEMAEIRAKINKAIRRETRDLRQYNKGQEKNRLMAEEYIASHTDRVVKRDDGTTPPPATKKPKER